MPNKIVWSKVAFLFILGFLGVLSTLPIIPELIAATGQKPSLPMPVIQAISLVQSSMILIAMVVVGTWLSPKINLGTPLMDAYFLHHAWDGSRFKQILFAGSVGGVLGGISLILLYQTASPFLPKEFIESAQNLSLPFYTKILYGGITEEILMRWGIMSFFVWLFYRVTQGVNSRVHPLNYIIGIILSALIFGAGHLPAASMLSPVVTLPLVAYVILGNGIFGLIAGYLYWKKGLECAVVAHMLAHVVMTVGEKIA